MEYSRAELREILRKHKDWLENKDDGVMARFGESDLSRENLSYMILCGADFTGANLLEANLDISNLSNAILVNTNLRNATLTNANLNGANLSCTDLSCADLNGANLTGADLTGANLMGADLYDVDLTGADLRGANTIGVIGQKVISTQLENMIEGERLTYWVNLDIWTWNESQGTLEEIRKDAKEYYETSDFRLERFERAVKYILNEVKEYENRCNEYRNLGPLTTASDEENELLELSKILKEGATKLKAYIDKITEEEKDGSR